MKKAPLMGVVGICATMATATAYASDTLWGRIVDLIIVDNGGPGYQVQTGASTFTNPKVPACSTGYYEAKAGLSAAQYDTMNRTLLSAFLAGRKVKLSISTTTCGPTNRPAYFAVRVNDTQ